jgi:hypothetical protein
MSNDAQPRRRYFTTYSGVTLPFRLVNPIPEEALANRNTFISASFDEAGALTAFEKIVYGEVELSHRYQYDDEGGLIGAEIVMPEEDPVVLRFDAPIRAPLQI